MTPNRLVISSEEVKQLLLQEFGLSGIVKPLAGELDLNYHFRTDDGREFVLKISQENPDQANIEWQDAILNFLAQSNTEIPFPTVTPNLSKNRITKWETGAESIRYIRLLSWLPGRLWAHTNPHSEFLLESLGRVCGLTTKALLPFDHPAGHRFLKWDLAQTPWVEAHLDLFQGKQRDLIAHFLAYFQSQILPGYPSLRKSIIHNDANDYNILVEDQLPAQKALALIDYGDAVYTQTINELAIACVYAIMDKPDPVAAAVPIIRGYHNALPLEEKEVEMLYGLIAARLIISLTVAAINAVEEPDNAYLQISAQPAWTLLEKWRQIAPGFAHYRFRAACGWTPCPDETIFQDWIRQNKSQLHPIVKVKDHQVAHLDLQVGSLALGNNANFKDITAFTHTINRLMQDQNAHFGWGGYGEIRPFYTTDAYEVIGNKGPQWRTVHLGLDVWGPAETPVYAPIKGKVASLQHNKGERDYGPTIVLEHETTNGLLFYTLYGHLNEDSIQRHQVGDSVEAGQLIANFGAPPVNGNWPPHLHFQIILDRLGWVGDFPGVAFPEEKNVWLSICPDPYPFVFNDTASTEHSNLDEGKILKIRKEKLGKSLSISYKKPLHMVRGFKQWLYDVDGRRFLDTVNNVAHVGHEHPKVVRAAQQQMGVLNTNTRYLHRNIVDFAEALLKKMPPELCVVHLVNSGSEANELALRMAKTYTGHQDMIALEVGYHGNTGACIDVSSYKFDGKGGKGAPEHTHILPMPDPYRGLHVGNNPETGLAYAQYLQQHLDRLNKAGKQIAGFIGESILSCGGQIVPPPEYFKSIYRSVRAAGGVCIADEVQVGFGRVGHHFWGFELHGVVPDIVTMGKPIGNGHPIGVVVSTRAVADAFANGMEFFSTFGGNPVSSIIAKEVLQVVEEEGLQVNALQTGKYLKQQLELLQRTYPIIGDIRGEGFFLGFELVADPVAKTPAAQQTAYLANRMRELGFLMSTDGPDYNVIKIKPPMCFNKANADALVDFLDGVFQEDFMKI